MNKMKLWDWLYIVGFCVMVAYTFFDASSLFMPPSFLKNFIICFFLFTMAMKLLHQSYSRVQLFAVLALLFLVLYSCLSQKYNTLLYGVSAACAIQNINIKKLLTCSYITKVVLLVIHVVSYIVTYMVSPEKITFVYRLDQKPRHFFFLGHANTFTVILVWTCIEIIYVYYDKIKKYQLGLIWLINFIFYQFTDSNTGLIVITGFIVICLMDKVGFSWIERVVMHASRYLFIVATLFSGFLMVQYTKFSAKGVEIADQINTFFTGRLLYGAYAYDVHGLTLLGRSIRFADKTYWRGHWFDSIIFDNTYLWFFILYGTIHLFIMCGLYYWVSFKTTFIERLSICFLAFYGLTEAYIINPFICFPSLLIGMYFYHSKKEELYHE